MIKNIALGKYLPGNSLIHKLDPRIKLITSALFLTFVFMAQRYSSLIILLIFVMLSAFMSYVPLKTYIKMNKSIIIISFFTALVNLFFEAETHFLKFGNFLITPQNLRISIIVFIRLILLILMSSLVMFTTSPGGISCAIESLLNPLKYIGVNVQEIAITITISLRFIPTLFEETDKIITAQRSRGANFKSKNLIKKIKVFSAVVIPIFISSFKKANDLATAMESRCYDSSRNRTKFKKLKIKSYDIAAVIFIILIFSGVILCNNLMNI